MPHSWVKTQINVGTQELPINKSPGDSDPANLGTTFGEILKGRGAEGNIT